MKAAWGPGPWQSEPDRLEWKDERTGLTCLIVREMLMGGLCGYVGVPPSHPYFGWRYNDHIKLAPGDLEDASLNDIGIVNAFCYALGGGPSQGTIDLGMTLKVHHGISWSGERDDFTTQTGLWFFGFDCGHAWDVLPGLEAKFRHFDIPDRQYRDIEYVKREVTSLAFQLRQLETRVLIDHGMLRFITSEK
jgi:hypothetical protein